MRDRKNWIQRNACKNKKTKARTKQEKMQSSRKNDLKGSTTL